MRVEATYDLVIDLVPGEGVDDSVLILSSLTEDDEEQSLVIMLDEVESLRAALAEAAAKLTALVTK